MDRPPRRRLVLRGIRYLVERPVTGVLAVLLSAAAIVVGVFAVPALGSLATGGTSVSLPRLQGGEPEATGAFLRGNRDYDASLVWQSFSDDVRDRLQSQGSSEDTLERQLQSARERGRKLQEITYIGGRDLSDGTSMQFYVVGLRQQARSELEFVPYVFTLDRRGKIARVQ